VDGRRGAPRRQRNQCARRTRRLPLLRFPARRQRGARRGEVGNLRYLHCALCNTEWNLVRVKCAACDATEGVSYRHLETEAGQGAGAVRAETCEACKSYLKIVYQEKGAVDPVADDLATLALDILVDEAGYARSGPNLLLVPGG
jgi:FdhE protein